MDFWGFSICPKATLYLARIEKSMMALKEVASRKKRESSIKGGVRLMGHVL